MLNNWCAVGRVSSPKINRTSTGVLYINFSLAVQREKQKNETEAKTDFIPCSIVGKIGEFFTKYIEQGDTISVCGSIQQSQYTDKNGQNVTKTECFVTKYNFISKPTGRAQSTQQAPQAAPVAMPQGIQAPPGYVAQVTSSGQVAFVPIQQQAPSTPPVPTEAPPENLPPDWWVPQ